MIFYSFSYNTLDYFIGLISYLSLNLIAISIVLSYVSLYVLIKFQLKIKKDKVNI